ncbi:MAG TPA: sugar transferase [Verrucomicrobiae bacterium]|nr:sugar transferase [Verrucomicrobiae bacterium]
MNSSDHKPLANGANPFGAPVWKRLLDCGLILLASPVLLPVMVLIAALVRLVSSGPVFFRQERVGFRGSRFMCFKFRTMFVGADTAVHRGHLNDLMSSNAPMVKMDHGDPRLIPFGLLLRSTGLDELPQIINVLRGEMSLVGPRPCIAYEYEKYTDEQKERFNTLPGLTGWWQVSGKNRTTFTEMIQLDIDYSRRKSLWFDIKIIFKTVPAILTQIRDVLARKTRKPAPAAVAVKKTETERTQPILPQRPFPVAVRAEKTKV